MLQGKRTLSLVGAGSILILTGLLLWFGTNITKPGGPLNAETKILFLGDTSFGENYQDRLEEQGKGNVLKEEGYEYLFQNFADILTDASFTIANLETPITDLEESPFVGKKTYIHYTNIDKAPYHLSKYGFDLVSLANNHSLDYGDAGLTQTLSLLDKKSIETCGAGKNKEEADKVFRRTFTVENNTFEVALICVFEYMKSYDTTYHFYAEEDVPGVALLSVPDITLQIKEIKEESPNTFVVIFPHWGENYSFSSENQKKDARALLDAGADLVIGHGAHMFQEIEEYKGKWIVYNIGNFVFPSPGRYEETGAHPYGFIAELILSEGTAEIARSLRLYPIFTDNLASDYQGRFVTEKEFQDASRIIRERFAGEVKFEEGESVYGKYFEIRL